MAERPRAILGVLQLGLAEAIPPPNEPTNPNPQDGATNISTTTQLSWECSDPDGDALTYDVYFGTDNTPDNGELVSAGQSETNYTPSNLENNTTYYWKIVAKDGNGGETAGPVWSFTTKSGGGGTGDVEWVDVPAGDYTYGQNDETRNINYDYKIMKYEVTNRQYADYLTEAYNQGSITVTSASVKGYYGGDEHWSAGDYEFYDLDDSDARIHWNGSVFTIDSGYEDHPVVEVTWFGANAFAKHYGYRLPTEEEWEKAARGNTGYDYPWGDTITGNDANYRNSGDPWDNGTTPVGYYNTTSPYGAYDMAGNVWDWCNNFWPSSFSNRALRGGSWDSYASVILSWNRYDYYPPYSNNNIGFRCLRTN